MKKTVKKFGALMLCVLLTFSAFTVFAGADSGKQQVYEIFDDINEGDWFVGAVQYAYNNKLFLGISDTLFAPNANMTRAMLVAVLYRNSRSPAVTGQNTFKDVVKGSWYENSVIWASEKGIVYGVAPGVFAPNANITRQDLVTIIYRYSEAYGRIKTPTRDLPVDNFEDASQISAYARDALQWAVNLEIVNGRTATTLAPRGTATRAEVAQIIYKFNEGWSVPIPIPQEPDEGE